MTILVQGAMDCEIDVLLDYFSPAEVKILAGYHFYVANYKNSKVVISKTEMGIINASTVTTIAIEEFQPDLVINQGCAGGHIQSIKNGDLIIGEKAVHINDFRTNPKRLGEGSNSLEWRPSKSRSYVVESTKKYIDIADNIDFEGQKYIGILGSGDLLSKEVDRINFLHSTFGELSEDMESVAALRVSERFGVDRIAFRIISNNEITNEVLDLSVCNTLQKFVISFIDRVS